MVCVRGAGNFSVRLYETLAMGRIPVFVNTDCIIPLENAIDWKAHVVWVEMDEIDKIIDKVLSFHGQLNKDSFIALSQANRRLWEERLRVSGFFMAQNSKVFK